MKLRSIFSSSLAVPYALICAYGLFAVTTPPQPGQASDPAMPGVTQAEPAEVVMSAAEATSIREPDVSAE